MAKKTPDDIRRLIKENDVRFVRLQFTDILGQLKNVAVTLSQVDKVLENKCMFDGSSIEGFVRIEESDMYLYPDLDSFAIFPWNADQGKVARLICDIYMPDGTPFKGSPRYILHKAIDHAAKMGYSINIGPECEFFLFETDEKGNPTTITQDEAGYFDLGPVDRGERARRDMCTTLEEMGFDIEASHHEVANGQHEIDFKYDEALKTADNIMTFKLAVKTIAQRHRLHATFMPKPIFGICGSGMHVNMSLTKGGKNAFYNAEDKLGLSKEAYSFIAGVMEHIPAITAVTNPLVNSYKRLVPGYEAPVYIAWSAQNRSPLIRIPASRGEGTRVELRSPDPSANPYLALALVIEAGLDGMERGLTPPASVDANIYEMSDEERAEKGIENLPENLYEAVKEMKKSAFVKNILGDHVFSKYVEAKDKEWQEYKTKVTAWEIDKYLITY